MAKSPNLWHYIGQAVPRLYLGSYVPAGYRSFFAAFNHAGAFMFGSSWTGNECFARWTCRFRLPTDGEAIGLRQDISIHSRALVPRWQVCGRTGWQYVNSRDEALEIWTRDKPLLAADREREIADRERFEKASSAFRHDLNAEAIMAAFHDPQTGEVFKVEGKFWASNLGGEVIGIPDRQGRNFRPDAANLYGRDGQIILPKNFLEPYIDQGKNSHSTSPKPEDPASDATLRGNQNSAVEGRDQVSRYSTVYLELMFQAIRELEVTTNNQLKKIVLVEWFVGKGMSRNLANAMATLIRLPESQAGRGVRKQRRSKA